MTDIPSDDTTTARLVFGEGIDGVLDFAGDTDLFRVELVGGRSYAFDMLGADSGFSLDDPLLSLLDETLSPITIDDDSGLGLDARIDYTAIATGTYYLRAATLGAIGGYRLRMTDTAGRIDDFGNSAVRAGTLAIGGSGTGTIDFLGDRDWFRVDLAVGQTYVFTVRGGLDAGDLTDPHLALYDAAGQLIDRNDDAAADTLDARITFTAASSGAYYLDAGAFGDLTGRYVIAADGPAAPTPETPATPVTPEPSSQPPATPEPTPVTPVPVTPAPVTPAPTAPEPVVPVLVTPAPVVPVPVTPPVVNVQAGTAGHDSFVARAGDDLILGGAGSDTISYAGLARSYSRAVSGGSGTITGGPEGGTDTLDSIETIRFADGYVTSDPASHAAQVHRLYTLVLERMPDSLGLNSWTQSLDRGGSLVGVANGFAGSVEFQTKTAGLSTSDFVEFLYNGALGRASDAAGKAGWVGAIDSGAHSRGEVIVGFSESAEYQSRVNAHLDDGLFIYDDTYAAIASLYDAFADRRPDAEGLANWVNIARHGHYSFEQIADGFANSSEFRAKIDGLDARGIVEQLYRNVLDREGDAGGIAGWTAKLEADHDVGSLLWEFARSTEHQVLMQPYLADGVVVL